MTTHSISHRLFAAALSQNAPAPVKRPVRSAARAAEKVEQPKGTPLNEAARKLGEWTWNGWQQTTI